MARSAAALCAFGASVLLAGPGALPSSSAAWGAARRDWPGGIAVVGYRSPQALQRALARFPGRIVQLVPALRVAEVRPQGALARFAAGVARLPGIAYVERLALRASHAEPALAPNFSAGPLGQPYEWQYAATREDAVPESVLRAASGVTIAVVDTGADLTAPDLAAKAPAAYDVKAGSTDVPDTNGHGTVVASLAAGSVSNGEGIAGFGGDAKLLVIRAAPDGAFSDVDEATAIVYAVDHDAKVINLSLGGPETSQAERNAVDYAVSHGVLLVAAAGNDSGDVGLVEYPAALLQPLGSNGRGGLGLSVAASDARGGRASFSVAGSWISLAAPGDHVLGDLSSTAPASAYPRVQLPGSSAGLYGFASGTSFAAPEVAGAAALVWAANPSLSAGEVAEILRHTASGHGSWNPEIGYGVIDVAAAVAKAQSLIPPLVTLKGERTDRRVVLSWIGQSAASYRLSVNEDRGPQRVLLPATTDTSAWYSLTPGHVYSFTVATLDATGSPTASSAPFTVALVRAQAQLSLSASRTEGAHPLAVDFTAVLRSRDASVPADSRVLVLESFDGRVWHSADRAGTSSHGRATWSVTLGPGSYRIRARFRGADDLAAATSRPIALTVS